MTVKDPLKNIHSEVKLPKIGSTKNYKDLMSIVRNRVTVRRFDAVSYTHLRAHET